MRASLPGKVRDERRRFDGWCPLCGAMVNMASPLGDECGPACLAVREAMLELRRLPIPDRWPQGKWQGLLPKPKQEKRT